MKIKLPTTLVNRFDRAIRVISNHSSEIYMGLSVVTGIGCVVTACYATTKVEDIVDEVKENIDDIHEAVENGEITELESKRNLTFAYAKAGAKIGLQYAPAIGLGTASLIFRYKGFNKMKKAAVTATAMYSAEHKKFNDYRKNLIERFDDKLDQELYYGIKKREVEEEVVDEKTGKVTTVKKTETYMDSIAGSPYAVLFDDYNPEWRGTNERTLTFIQDIEMWAQDQLVRRIDYTSKKVGYLYLNEVLEQLGFRGTEKGSMAGWIYDPEGWLEGKYDPNEFSCDHKVSFGIFDKRGNDCHNCARFQAGDENAIWLDFNVHGYIPDKI